MKNLLAGLLIATAAGTPSANAQPAIDPPKASIIADYLLANGLEDKSGNFTFEHGTSREDAKNQVTYIYFNFRTSDKASGGITIMLRRDTAQAAKLLDGGDQSDFYRLAAEAMHNHATTGQTEETANERRYFWAWRAPSGQLWEDMWAATHWQNADIIVSLRNGRPDLLVTRGDQRILDQTFNDALAVGRIATSATVGAFVAAPVEDLMRTWKKTFGSN